ncbi:hypothetical protein [Mesorhizobium tamadayense]|uniref:hypothetical protein n=1 Tax=Mesorhizobium tamadayense TaxID=425306 RepID=UPI001980DC57|nr:hypothetical protein [Mesorhizobium tamadayense]
MGRPIPRPLIAYHSMILGTETRWRLAETPITFVILGRSKERSDAAQTPGSCRDIKALLRCRICSAAFLGYGHGMDPWVCAPLRVATPKDDDFGEASAQLRMFANAPAADKVCTTPQFWMNMQASYDLAVEGEAKKAEIDAIEQMQAA